MIWLKRKYMWLSILLLPVFLIFLVTFSYYRSENTIHYNSIDDSVNLFFVTQGNSAHIIGFAKECENELPENKFYSLGPVITFIKENAFAKVFTDVPQYENKTANLALNGDSFAEIITYIKYPILYLRGGGLGSCYIAELWVDFGYIGICVGSFILGWLMAKFIPFCKRNVWLTTITFSGALMIIYSPRAEFLGFLYIILSYINLFVFFGIYLLAKNNKSKTRKTYKCTCRPQVLRSWRSASVDRRAFLD